MILLYNLWKSFKCSSKITPSIPTTTRPVNGWKEVLWTLWLIYIGGDRCGDRFRFQKRWSHCTKELGFIPHKESSIVLCRTCSHCTDSDLDPYSLFLCRTGIRDRVCSRVHLRHCKWAIKRNEMYGLLFEWLLHISIGWVRYRSLQDGRAWYLSGWRTGPASRGPGTRVRTV